jgi:hypothetical protein
MNVALPHLPETAKRPRRKDPNHQSMLVVMTQDLAQRLTENARGDRRSRNAQIQVLLEEALAARAEAAAAAEAS